MSFVKQVKENSVLDEIYFTFEEIIKQHLHQLKNSSNKLYPQLANNYDPRQKAQFRAQIMEKYEDLAQKCLKPIQEIISQSINIVSQHPATLAKHESLEKFSLKEKGDCGKLHNKIQKYSSQANFKTSKIVTNLVEKESLSFDRYNDFITYPHKCVGVKQLTISIQNQGIGDNGIENVASQLQKFNNVESLHLNLSYNNISEKGAEFLGRSLFNLKNLRSLNLGLYNNKLKETGVKHIMSNISNMRFLQELNLQLACNSIGNKGISIVGFHISNLRNLSKLWLGAYNNQIFEVGMKEFLHHFSKFPVFKVLKLDFRLNPITNQNQAAMKNIIKQKKIVECDISF